jgi:2-hydroxycyclohexanecarboxyl-CoA dehydrogenase
VFRRADPTIEQIQDSSPKRHNRDMRFADMRAAVTGGASGIGAATARLLAREGARVAVLDLDEPGAREVADDITGISAYLDLADLESIPGAAAGLVSRLGGLELLVNCAGWDLAMRFQETDMGFWRKVVDVNLLGPIALSHALLPSLSDGSAIVNVSSDAGRVGSSGEVVYSGAKAGIIGFSKALAREVASRQIRVNVVAPGPTDTPFLASFDESGKLAAAMQRQTPLGKLATPDDVASAIAFLGSSDAGHITGQVLSVSGGLTMV